MVRLKATSCTWVKIYLPSFNSLMVRLKVPHAAIKPIVTVKFQFLDGAIKSRIREQLLQAPQTFQFLDGAIKRSALYECNLFRVCFNSLMVRLKAHENENRIYTSARFQFLDGAIKSDKRAQLLHRVGRFQFLDGAIKRRPPAPALLPPLRVSIP